MRLSKAVFKVAIAVSLTIFVLTLALVPFLEPGDGSWEVSVFTLGISALMFTIAALGLYFRWDFFRPFEEL